MEKHRRTPSQLLDPASYQRLFFVRTLNKTTTASFGPTRTPAIPIPATMEEARRANSSGSGASSSSPSGVGGASSAPAPTPLSPRRAPPALFGSHAAGSAPSAGAVAAAGAGAAFGSPFKVSARSATTAGGGGFSPAAAPSTPRPVPTSLAPSAAAEPQAISPGKRSSPSSRRRGGKIDGLDYYEYVELIRASSL